MIILSWNMNYKQINGAKDLGLDAKKFICTAHLGTDLEAGTEKEHCIISENLKRHQGEYLKSYSIPRQYI